VSRIASGASLSGAGRRWIVGAAAGSAPDLFARVLGQWLSDRLGRSFVIDNKPGAGTNIATETVVRAPQTATRSFLSRRPTRFNATLYDKLNFNFIRDIAPVASIGRIPNVMAVNPSFPAKSVPEFIA